MLKISRFCFIQSEFIKMAKSGGHTKLELTPEMLVVRD